MEGGKCSSSHPGDFTQGVILHYPLYREMGGLVDRSGCLAGDRNSLPVRRNPPSTYSP